MGFLSRLFDPRYNFDSTISVFGKVYAATRARHPERDCNACPSEVLLTRPGWTHMPAEADVTIAGPFVLHYDGKAPEHLAL
jgi:hypothetical protein